MSGLKRTDDGRPLMQPGAGYTFDMNLTSGGVNGFTTPGTWTPRPIDLIEFDSVRWDDGTYDGNPPFPHVDAIIESDSGRRLQLRRIVDALWPTLEEPTSGLELLASARKGQSRRACGHRAVRAGPIDATPSGRGYRVADVPAQALRSVAGALVAALTFGSREHRLKAVTE